MDLLWTSEAWDDYLHWQVTDKQCLKRINLLLKDIQRSPYVGVGKPEPLKGNLTGWWSRRIDEVNRIVYRQCGNSIEITQCGGHYSA